MYLLVCSLSGSLVEVRVHVLQQRFHHVRDALKQPGGVERGDRWLAWSVRLDRPREEINIV